MTVEERIAERIRQFRDKSFELYLALADDMALELGKLDTLEAQVATVLFIRDRMTLAQMEIAAGMKAAGTALASMPASSKAVH